MLGSGGCSGRTPILAHTSFQGAAYERPQFAPLPRTTPSYTSAGEPSQFQRRMAELESDDCGNAACVISAFYYLGT